jgi:hypothetical protein
MVNRIAKREFGIWMRQNCPSEIQRCIGTFVKSRGFKGAEVLIERLYKHDPTLPEGSKGYAIGMLNDMRERQKQQERMVAAGYVELRVQQIA